MAPLRVGVIGVGAMGANHARVYSQMPGVELVGVADREPSVASQVAESCMCAACSAACELLDHGVDAVTIAVPTSLHADTVVEALTRGVHVLVEKPMADNVPAAEQMVLAAEKSGVRLLVGHTERFNPAVRKLKDCIDEGLLGDVISMSARRVGPYSPRIRDVGIILDLATHDINVMAHLSGSSVRRVYATADTVMHAHEDHAILTLTFENGMTGVIETNWLTPHKVRTLTVVGSRAVAVVDYIGMTLDIYDAVRHHRLRIGKAEPLRVELAHFVACCRYGTSPMVSGQDGMHAVAVAVAARESAARCATAFV